MPEKPPASAPLVNRETDTQASRREAPPSGTRLAPRKIQKILTLKNKGKSNREISQLCNCDIKTVAAILNKWQDMRPLARRMLEAKADELAKRVLNSRNAMVALKTLGKLDVVREDNAPGGPQVVVVLGSTIDPLSGRTLSPQVSQDFHRLTDANKDDSVV